jgi:hypothetical protein
MWIEERAADYRDDQSGYANEQRDHWLLSSCADLTA